MQQFNKTPQEGFKLVNLLNKGENIMTKITSFDLTPFYRQAIGVDRLFDTIMDRIDHNTGQSNYPPYNIIKVDDNNYEIELAVAGFEEGEIDLQVQNGDLVIVGEKKTADVRNFLHLGIGTRKFIRSFQLSDYVEVQGAVVANGILSIKLERIVPESMKPKTIAITYQK